MASGYTVGGINLGSGFLPLPQPTVHNPPVTDVTPVFLIVIHDRHQPLLPVTQEQSKSEKADTDACRHPQTCGAGVGIN